jgi:Protein of unknown function, DUF481
VPATAIAIATIAVVVFTGTAHAQGRTDVVTLANGDRITGEIIRLERGRLEFKTDDAGTIYFEWDKLVGLVAARLVEVVTIDGRWILGTLAPAPGRSLGVVTPVGTITLLMMDVNAMVPIGRSFWDKLDGSIDAGFSYTHSSGIAQLNLNSDTVFRTPAFEARLTGSLTQTEQEDVEAADDDRGFIDLSYIRYRWRIWFFKAAGRFETNESLGLTLRSQFGFSLGPRLLYTNRAQVVTGAGVSVNNEQGVDVEATQNIEALFYFRASYFTYDRPKTNFDLTLQYYPSLSDFGRQRLQLDASAKRELWKDFFVSLNVYNTFDSRPPNPAADTNDVGIVMSIGWSY